MLWKHCIQSARGISVQFTHKLYAVLPYYSDNSKLFIYPLQNRLHFRKRRCSLFFLGNTAFYHERENQSSKKQKNCPYHRMIVIRAVFVIVVHVQLLFRLLSEQCSQSLFHRVCSVEDHRFCGFDILGIAYSNRVRNIFCAL